MEAWAECPRGVRTPSPLHFSHIQSKWTQQPATNNSEPALLPHLKQPNKSQFWQKIYNFSMPNQQNFPWFIWKWMMGYLFNGLEMASWKWLNTAAFLLLPETPLAAMTAVAELSLLCQIDKMTWERGGGRFCLFFLIFSKIKFPSFCMRLRAHAPNFQFFIKMLNKTF